MIKKLRKIFIFNGFEADEILPIRYQLVAKTIDGLKKLAMGIGTLDVLAMILEWILGRKEPYLWVDVSYLLAFTAFMLLVKQFQKTENYQLAEFATLFFVVLVLSISIYDSTILSVNSRGVLFPIFLILIAVTFTGNPLVIDLLMLLMTGIYLAVSAQVKEPFYFQQDLFTGIFTLLISNMVNATTSRSHISEILRTNEVEESRRKYKNVYDTVPCGVIEYRIRDGRQTLVDINRSGLELLGRTKEELTAETTLDLVGNAHPDDQDYLAEILGRIKKVGDQEAYEYRTQRKNGTFLWIAGQIRAVEVSDGTVTVLSACVNVDAEKKAIDANEAKSKFLSRMSHDIRTPMNAIIGLTRLVLEDPKLTDPVRTNMESIESSSKFLLGLINDILDVSKMEADEMRLHPEPYSQEEFVNYLNTMIRPLCEQKKIVFKIETKTSKESWVSIDPVRFNQIFFNLLSNAVKFTPKGGTILVRIETANRTEKVLREHFVILDTGIGMSREFQKHMFDAFSQENTEHVNESQGTGLGLSIVKRIIDLMGGTIEVQSEPNEGTRYDLYLDLEICVKKKKEKQSVEIASLQGRHVLICEDHPINRQIAEALLEKAGMTFETANDGAEGVAKFQESAPGTFDAILMDIRMPIMGGLEASKTIRSLSRPDAAQIPIIAMTANVFDTDRNASMKAGMNAHIGKPIDPQILYQTLTDLIQNQKS